MMQANVASASLTSARTVGDFGVLPATVIRSDRASRYDLFSFSAVHCIYKALEDPVCDTDQGSSDCESDTRVRIATFAVDAQTMTQQM